jgi:hypothetical protein
MKILLICNEDEPHITSYVDPLLKKLNIETEVFMVNPYEHSGHSIKKEFAAFFTIIGFEGDAEYRKKAPSHSIVLSPLSLRWLDFFAGFSYGSHFPFLIYNEAARMATPEEFNTFFASFKTEESLERYLESESIAIRKQEEAREITKARDTLIQLGVPVNLDSLSRCIEEEAVREVSLFLTAGFSPNSRNKAGVPLLNLAARKGSRDITDILLSAGADLNNAAEDRGTSAIIDATMDIHYEIVSYLIDAGADLNMRSKDGQTALILATGDSNLQMVEMLLKAGADADIKDSLGVSARKYAQLFHNEQILKLFNTYAPEKL